MTESADPRKINNNLVAYLWGEVWQDRWLRRLTWSGVALLVIIVALAVALFVGSAEQQVLVEQPGLLSVRDAAQFQRQVLLLMNAINDQGDMLDYEDIELKRDLVDSRIRLLVARARNKAEGDEITHGIADGIEHAYGLWSAVSPAIEDWLSSPIQGQRSLITLRLENLELAANDLLTNVNNLQLELITANRQRADDLALRYNGISIALTLFVVIVLAIFLRLTRKEQQARLGVERQLGRLRALHDIDLAITSDLDMGATLERVLERVVGELEMDAASIFVLDKTSGRLNPAAFKGFRSTKIETFSPLPEESLVGEVAATGKPLVIADLSRIKAGLHSRLGTEEGFQAYFANPLIVKGELLGVLETMKRESFQPSREWLDFFRTLAGQAAIAVDNAQLFEGLAFSNESLKQAYDRTLEGWARALELRDQQTAGHSRRVTDLTVRLTEALGISEAHIEHVRRGAIVHDIGKMGVPDSILLKPGKLTAKERAIMEQHCQYGYDMLWPIEYLRPALDIPWAHHEKWDGTGYPRGLKGEEIPLPARAFAIVDVWDALRSDRPYRKAWSVEKTIEHIRSESGKHFEPRVVEAFLELAQGEGLID